MTTIVLLAMGIPAGMFAWIRVLSVLCSRPVNSFGLLGAESTCRVPCNRDI